MDNSFEAETSWMRKTHVTDKYAVARGYHQFERCIQRTNEGNVAHTDALTVVYTQNNCRYLSNS